MTGRADPVAGVDALVASIAPRARPPADRHHEVVLVTGPRLAGVTAVATALTGRLPERVVVEASALPTGAAPAVVVFVVSAAAALTDSDCALLDAAAVHTDAVIGVVAKIDLHRHWPQMLDLARQTLAARAARYRDTPWVGAAARPGRGEPRADDLVEAVCDRLAAPDTRRRNRLRSWESQLQALARRQHRAAADRRERIDRLRRRREAQLRRRRLDRTAQTIALRGRIARARVQLTHIAGSRCAALRGELQEAAGRLTRRRLPSFEEHLRARFDAVIGELDEGVAAHLVDVAAALGLTAEPPPAPRPTVQMAGPALRSRRLETRLMTVLGAGFGLGMTLTLGRLLTGLPAGLGAVGAVACAAVGLASAVWVVGTRGLLLDRALLDRWVAEAVAALRSAAEELVAVRVLAAESALSAELAERHESAAARAASSVAALDGELGEHAAVGAACDRELPALRRALAAVRAELGDDGGHSPAHGAVVTRVSL